MRTSSIAKFFETSDIILSLIGRLDVSASENYLKKVCIIALRICGSYNIYCALRIRLFLVVTTQHQYYTSRKFLNQSILAKETRYRSRKMSRSTGATGKISSKTNTLNVCYLHFDDGADTRKNVARIEINAFKCTHWRVDDEQRPARSITLLGLNSCQFEPPTRLVISSPREPNNCVN